MKCVDLHLHETIGIVLHSIYHTNTNTCIVQLAGILNSFSKILLDNRWEYLLGGRYPVKSRSEQHSKTTKNPIQFEGKPFLN